LSWDPRSHGTLRWRKQTEPLPWCAQHGSLQSAFQAWGTMWATTRAENWPDSLLTPPESRE